MNQKEVENISKSALRCFQENFPRRGNIGTFPKNCCEESSFILLAILEQLKIYDFNVIKGTAIDGHHHFWLESESYIIDLTCHQFEEISEPAILISKENYILSKNYPRQQRVQPFQNWEYLNRLKPKILEIFLLKYYTKN